MEHILEDVRRDTLCEVLQTLRTKGLLNEEIEHVFTASMTSPSTIVVKNTIKKEKKPRFSAYHLFMKEHRAVVKQEHPEIKPQVMTSIVSKAWKDVPEEQKETLRIRALQMKEEYNTKSVTKSISSNIKEVAPKVEKNADTTVKKPKANLKITLKEEEEESDYSDLDSESSDEDDMGLALESDDESDYEWVVITYALLIPPIQILARELRCIFCEKDGRRALFPHTHVGTKLFK